LGKILPNEDLINKVLRCLSRQWQQKVIAIIESRDLINMSIVTLFGKLQELEMKLMRLHQHEENDKKRKGIALRQQKVIAITESRDLINMSIVTLFRKLQELEMEILRLHQHEENDKKKERNSTQSLIIFYSRRK